MFTIVVVWGTGLSYKYIEKGINMKNNVQHMMRLEIENEVSILKLLCGE